MCKENIDLNTVYIWPLVCLSHYTLAVSVFAKPWAPLLKQQESLQEVAGSLRAVRAVFLSKYQCYINVCVAIKCLKVKTTDRANTVDEVP